MLGLTDYFWRLIPANPILLRVVESGGKRKRDLAIRSIYLGILVFFVIFSYLSNIGGAGKDLAGYANDSALIFQQMSYLQLALVALIAPIFTAGAITQEKDSQTYDILLSTPLTNGQIVLGSLLSRLFFVIALLISGIPVFSITQIFGGVLIANISLSFAVAASTAFVTGAMAMAIATFKVGTRRTIFSFYLFIVIYLVGGFLLDHLDVFKVALVDPLTGNTTELSKTGWLTGIHPFLALRTILFDKDYLPPGITQLPEPLRYWPVGWYLSNPCSFFISFMFVLSFVLVIPSIILLRRLAQSSTTLRGWILQKLKLSSGDRNRKPRAVWSNPIAWREARTKASAARATLVRSGFIVLGMTGAILLVVLYSMKLPAVTYIDRTSYNAETSSLSVYSANDSKTYRVWPNTTFSLDDRPAHFDEIRDKLDVSSPGLNITPNGAGLTMVSAKSLSSRISLKDARRFLLGLVIVEFSVILLIVTNAAASTVTREKEDGTLDLLLSTPITSRYYIWGKLRGLVSYVLPLVAVPAASVLVFVINDLFQSILSSGNSRWMVFPEAIVILPATLIIVAAFSAILGMHMSLRCRTTVMAVMSSVGIVVGICATLGWCGFNLLSGRAGGNEFGVVLSSFSPFTVLTLLIDPEGFGGKMFDTDNLATGRFLSALFSLVALGAYTAVVWAMYSSMVKNFDMTIRKQSR